MKSAEFFNQGKRFFLEGRDGVAKYAKQRFPAESRKIIAYADDIAQRKFVFNLRWDMEQTDVPVVFDREIDWLKQPYDDPEWIYAFNRMHFWLCLGQAYALTKNEKYASAFADQMCHWVDHVKRGDPKCDKAWRTIEAGLRMEYWMKAICFFEGSPALTDEVMDHFISSMTEHAEYIIGIYNSYNLMSNWGVLANHGLFLAGVMLPSTPRTAEYRKEALRRLDQEIRIQVYPDGVQWEQSPMYHNEVAHDFLDVVLLAGRNRIDLPEAIVCKTRDMCLADLYAQKPDGNELSNGDSDEIDDRDILSKGAYLYRDGLLKYGGYEHLDFDTVWDLGYTAIREYDAIPVEKPKRNGMAFSDSGNYYFRSDWSRDASFLHFHCGTLGAGHGHSDQLHFDLFSRGEDIFIDGGRFTYVDKPERYEFKDPSAHNTTTVDHQKFTVCRDSWGCSKLCRPVNRKFADCGRYGYAEGGHLGYYDLKSGGVFVNRRIIIIHPDLYVIVDEFYTDGKHSYEQYFHFNNAGTVTGEGTSFEYVSGKNHVRLISLQKDLSARLVPTRLSRHYNHAENNVTLETEFSGDGFTSAFTVISLDGTERESSLDVKKIPVRSNFKGTIFEDGLIEAVNIKKGNRVFTVVVAHQEYASPTDTFNADGCTGFGNTVVFDRSAGETEIGTVLAY
jgi:hypothetical protein